MKALLIEDNKSLAESISLLLAREGIICDLAHFGEDGVDLAVISDYGIIVVDIMLPDIDGFEVIQRIKSQEILSPILVLSGIDGEEEQERAIELGAEEYLTKPFDNAQLVEKLNIISRRSEISVKPLF